MSSACARRRFRPAHWDLKLVCGSVKSCKSNTLRFGTGRQRRAFERGSHPKPQRRTCSPRYGVQSRGGKSAGVANTRRVGHLPPEITIRNFRVAVGGRAHAGRQRVEERRSCRGRQDAHVQHLAVVRGIQRATKKVANRNVGGFGWESLTRPFRDARRSPSTRWYLGLTCTRTTRKFGICPYPRAIFCRAVPSAKP
jgi:hypothetical protein